MESQNKSHVPTNIHWSGKSQNQEIKTHYTVQKHKAMLKTRNTSKSPSVGESSSGQSRGQQHVGDTGMKINFTKIQFLLSMAIKIGPHLSDANINCFVYTVLKICSF